MYIYIYIYIYTHIYIYTYVPINPLAGVETKPKLCTENRNGYRQLKIEIRKSQIENWKSKSDRCEIASRLL